MRLAFFDGSKLKSGPVQIKRMSVSEFSDLVAEDERRKEAMQLAPQLDMGRLMSSVAESITIDPDEEIPDCQTCGLCCFHDPVVGLAKGEGEVLGAYVAITDDSEPDVVVDHLIERDFEKGCCVHLNGRVGVQVECAAYNRRPAVCRSFEAGSDRCREYRRMYGLDPQLSDEQVARLAVRIGDDKPGIITNATCRVTNLKISHNRSDTEPGSFVMEKIVLAKIHVAVNGDLANPIELHAYDPYQELWLESRFVGMTLDEAKELIDLGGEQGVALR